MQFFFVKCYSNFFLVKIISNIFRRHCIFNYFNHKKVLYPYDDDTWVDPSEVIDFEKKYSFKVIICPNKVWKLNKEPRRFKIFTSFSREHYYSLLSLVVISSRSFAYFGTRKYVSFFRPLWTLSMMSEGVHCIPSWDSFFFW